MITSSGPEVVDEQRLWVDWRVSVRRPEHFVSRTSWSRRSAHVPHCTAHAGDEHPPLRPLHRSSIGSTSPVCVTSLTAASSPSKWAAPAWPPNPAVLQRDHCRSHRLTYRGCRFPV